MAKNQLFNIINIILLQLYIYMEVQFALSVYDINFIHFNWSCTNVYINFTRYEKLKYNIEIWQHFNCLASNFKTLCEIPCHSGSVQSKPSSIVGWDGAQTAIVCTVVYDTNRCRYRVFSYPMMRNVVFRVTLLVVFKDSFYTTSLLLFVRIISLYWRKRNGYWSILA